MGKKKSDINEEVKQFHRWLHQSRFRLFDKVKWGIEDFFDKIASFRLSLVYIVLAAALSFFAWFEVIRFGGTILENLVIINEYVLIFLVLCYEFYDYRKVKKESEEFWTAIDKGDYGVLKGAK